MASVERDGGLGVKPWLRGQGAKSPESERIFYNKWLSFVIKIQRIGLSSFFH